MDNATSWKRYYSMRGRRLWVDKFPESKHKEFDYTQLRYLKKMRKYYEKDPMFNVYESRVNDTFF